MNTPPIVWQQSYLNWLEHEEGEIDYADARHSFLELLKQIADALETFPGFKEPQEILQSAGVETSGTLKILPENSLAKDPGAAARRLDMGYNPVPGLL